MQPILLHPIIFYFLLFFELMLMGIIFYFIVRWYKMSKFDSIIFIDRSNRWNLIRDKIGNSSTYNHDNKKYFVSEDTALLNKKGRSLYIFSEGKPQGFKIAYNKSQWLTSESMMSIINNKMIQKLVQTQDAMFDKLVLFGAIGGMLAGVASVLILLKQFGVI